MKKFQFQLESALAFRQQRLEAEQARMDMLHQERLQLIQEAQELQRRWVEAQHLVVESPSVDPVELAALAGFHRGTEQRKSRIVEQVQELDGRIVKQRKLLLEATREVRLIEKLKARRLKEWSAQMERELENEAADFYLAKWGRHLSQ